MAIAIYARKSVERENSISCETLIEYCKAAIRPDERNEKVLTFVDNGFSGGNVNREGFQKMMKAVRQSRISKVLVYKLDRISRSLSDFVGILSEFKEYNVEFVSSQESFDTSSPYGEMIVKILMVFAEFERTSIINRVTQAYEHRSDLGLYMGGRCPYGFELTPTIIHNVKTKKLIPISAEIAQISHIFEVYSQERVSLRRLQMKLLADGITPLDGSDWTTAKLSTLLKNPIYVKADSAVYDYYERHGTKMVTDISAFTGQYGAQLYGRNKHNSENADWSDMKLVLMTHEGVIDADIWLKCQKKLNKNRQITNSYSNPTSWLAGKVVCEQCGYTMTTIKGKPAKNGEIRRYFNCTGKSNKKCGGPKTTIYAENLENMIYDCITEKLSELKEVKRKPQKNHSDELNELRLKIKVIEQSESQLINAIMGSSFNSDLLSLANEKATKLKRERLALLGRIGELKAADEAIDSVVDLTKAWKKSDYDCKKDIAMLMIHKILICEDGGIKIIWNI